MIKKFDDILNEDISGGDVTVGDIKEIMKMIWKYYGHLKLITENGRLVLKIENDQEIFSTGNDRIGIASIYSYLCGIRVGMMMCGKNLPFPPKKIISKIDPYGEEDWDN